ncbi:MAG TPA: hypothetical protein VJK07_02585 [Candidatus Nanoarchaeia archaeon]|nr:hypothetical protein [Candidatus Nanoarchaeia archaeon]
MDNFCNPATSFRNSLYPVFRWIEHRGVFIPDVPLPRNYKDLVPAFYAAGGREKVEEYAKTLESSLASGFNAHAIRLKWDDVRGLSNIGVGMQGGLDLNKRGDFQEHNLGTITGFLSGAVAMRYVALLINPKLR